MTSHLKVLPTNAGANNVTKHGHSIVLKWMAGFGEPIYPTEHGPNYAAQNDHLDVLK